MSQKTKLFALLEAGGKLVMQGGSRLHNHGSQPTIMLRETKRHAKAVRKVTHIYASENGLHKVRDHVGETWLCKRMADGNFRMVH